MQIIQYNDPKMQRSESANMLLLYEYICFRRHFFAFMCVIIFQVLVFFVLEKEITDL